MQGLLIAPAARDWLVAPAAPAIHSLYRSSVNLVDASGELLSLVMQDSGPGPFALVVRPATPGFQAAGGFEAQLRPDSPVAIEPGLLRIGPLGIEHAQAALWNPRPAWERIDRDRLEERLPELQQLLIEHAPPGSFAPLADPENWEWESRRTAQTQPSGMGDDSGLIVAALHAALTPSRQLVSALQAGDLAAIGQAAERLAGLGGGVTPSGDDYLLGAMQALWALADPEPAQSLTHAIASHAVPHTNLISGAWLKAAERGQAGNEWHVLAVSLASGGPIGEAAGWLIQRGHTSGADALAGFLAAAKALLG